MKKILSIFLCFILLLNMTGDCVITSLTNNSTIPFNGYTITLADETVLSA